MENQDREQGQWFVVQTMSGQELKVKHNIEKRREQEGVDDLIYEALVPTEKVSEVRHGRKTTTERKFFPGYILVRMHLFDDEGNPIHRAWYYIRETQGVIGFIGGEKPAPLPASEIEAILHHGKEGEEAAKPKVQFEVGETVTIKDGAFENFEGTIENVDADRGKLRVSVSIFGRSTPVEVEYWQVGRS